MTGQREAWKDTVRCFCGLGRYQQSSMLKLGTFSRGRGLLVFEKGQKQRAQKWLFSGSQHIQCPEFHPLEELPVCLAFMLSRWLISLFMVLMCPIFFHLRGIFFVSLSLHINNIRAFLKAWRRVLLGCMSS